jgi:hypothetical protein
MRGFFSKPNYYHTILLVKIDTKLFFLGCDQSNNHNQEENLLGSPEKEISNHRN